MNSLIVLGAWDGTTPENIEMAFNLHGSLNGIEMRSSGSTSDSRYDSPLCPALLPRIEVRG